MATNTRTKTTPAAPASNPLLALLETVETEPKRKDSTRSRDRAGVEVPPEYAALVLDAFKNDRRVVLPMTDKDLFDQAATLFRAAGDQADPKLSVTVKARYNGEGDAAELTHLTFTVGERRGGRKAKNGDGDAPAAE